MSAVPDNKKALILSVLKRLENLVASRPSGDSVGITEYETWGREWVKVVVRVLRYLSLDFY